MPDRETWKFINSFAPWLSAIGTIAAAVVALKLARRSAKVKLRILNTVQRTVVDDKTTRFLCITVVNHGYRECTISETSLQLVPRRKLRRFLERRYETTIKASSHLLKESSANPSRPTKLLPGEVARFAFDIDNPIEHFLWRDVFSYGYKNSRGLLRHTYVVVETILGDVVRVPLDPDVRDWFVMKLDNELETLGTAKHPYDVYSIMGDRWWG